MFVAIEYAPVFVAGGTATALLFAQVNLALLDGFLNEAEWRAMEIVNDNVDLISVLPKPIVDVVRFGCSALREDENLPESRSG